MERYCVLSLSKTLYMRRSTDGGDMGSGPPWKINIGFLSNTGPDPLENYKATKPAINVRP